MRRFKKLVIIGVVPKRSKGTVCKIVIHRFESGQRLFLLINFARVVKLVDTRDLKSLEGILRAGSSPAPGTHGFTTRKILPSPFRCEAIFCL